MKETRPKLLVLDGQGVVFNAPVGDFLRTFSRQNGLDHQSVEQRWRSELRMLAWTGAIDDETLWDRLAGKKVDCTQTMATHDASYAPGPAAKHLLEWSRLVPIWLLSNHRAAWVLPHLDRSDLTGVFQKRLISDETGLVKPDPDAFRQILGGDYRPEDILFVDDKRRNTRAAAQLGIQTILASPMDAWVDKIEMALHVPS